MNSLILALSALRIFHHEPIGKLQHFYPKAQFSPAAHFSTASGAGKRFFAKTLRTSPGVVKLSCTLPQQRQLLWGSDQNAGFIPEEIGNQLQGREFHSFDQFRQFIWKTISLSNYAPEFSLENRERITTGLAPFAPGSQQLPELKRFSYELHHIQPINQGGAVYDPCNLMIVTPRFHDEVLIQEYHYGQIQNLTTRTSIGELR